MTLAVSSDLDFRGSAPLGLDLFFLALPTTFQRLGGGPPVEKLTFLWVKSISFNCLQNLPSLCRCKYVH